MFPLAPLTASSQDLTIAYPEPAFPQYEDAIVQKNGTEEYGQQERLFCIVPVLALFSN